MLELVYLQGRPARQVARLFFRVTAAVTASAGDPVSDVSHQSYAYLHPQAAAAAGGAGSGAVSARHVLFIHRLGPDACGRLPEPEYDSLFNHIFYSNRCHRGACVQRRCCGYPVENLPVQIEPFREPVV